MDTKEIIRLLGGNIIAIAALNGCLRQSDRRRDAILDLLLDGKLLEYYKKCFFSAHGLHVVIFLAKIPFVLI